MHGTLRRGNIGLGVAPAVEDDFIPDHWAAPEPFVAVLDCG
jgi:hypothetical protein